MNEHRRNERVRLQAFTPVYNSNKTSLLGYLGDLSMKGAMLIGEKPMEIDTQIILTIDFPETPEFTARSVRIPSRVAWCRQEESSQYYNTGLEFQNIAEMYKPYLEAILDRYHFQRPLRP